MSGDEWLERMAECSPIGPPCETCGGETRLVILRGAWCPKCRVLRSAAEDRRGTIEAPKPTRARRKTVAR